nr:hypothetical protein [Streptococcus intermedius]
MTQDSKDNAIEAIATTDKIAYLGVQWYFEYLFETRPKDRLLFDYVGNKL